MSSEEHNSEAEQTQNDPDADRISDLYADKSGIEAERVLASVGELALDPYQPRKMQSAQPADEEFQSLVNSIKKDGMLNDLLVRPVDASEHEFNDEINYLIIGGSRRYRAVQQAGRSGLSIPCKVVDADDETAQRMALVDNVRRKDLSDYELLSAIARMFNRLEAKLPPESGKIPCPVKGCEKEANGRRGLSIHLNSHESESDVDAEDTLRRNLPLSKRDIYEEIAEDVYGDSGRWQTVREIVRVSNLPESAMDLVKNADERSKADSKSLKKFNIADDTRGFIPTPSGLGSGVPKVLVALASLNDASGIEMDGRRATYLIRAYAAHESDDTSLTIAKIKTAVEAWEDDGADPEDAFENALQGDLPESAIEEPEPEPEIESEDVPEGTDEPESDDATDDDLSPSPEADDTHEPATEPTTDVDASDDLEAESETDDVGESVPDDAPTFEGDPSPASDIELLAAAAEESDPEDEHEPVELKATHRELVKLLPATGPEIASELDISQSTVRDWVSSIRKAHGEDLIETPSRETTYRWIGPDHLDDAPIDLTKAQKAVIVEMPGTPEQLAEATDYAVASVKARVSEIKSLDEDGDLLKFEKDDDYRWNGPEQIELTITASGSDVISISPAGAITPELARSILAHPDATDADSDDE